MSLRAHACAHGRTNIFTHAFTRVYSHMHAHVCTDAFAQAYMRAMAHDYTYIHFMQVQRMHKL